MVGGLDYIFINLTNNAAYLSEVSRLNSSIFLKSISRIDYPAGGSIFINNFPSSDTIKFEELSYRFHTGDLPDNIIVSVPTPWGQVKVLPALREVDEADRKSIWNELLNEAFANKTGDFNLNFLDKNAEEVWCVGLSKIVVSRILGLFPPGLRKRIIIVPDMALLQGYYETLPVDVPALYISGNDYRECWFLDAAKKESEYRLIFPDSGFPEVTYHKSLEDFIMFLEKKYGLELERIYLVEADTEGKTLADAFGDRLLEYSAIPSPDIAFGENNLFQGYDSRFKENILIEIYSAAALIN